MTPLPDAAALLAALPQPAALLDAEGRVLAANAAAERQLGAAVAGRRLEAPARRLPCGGTTLALLEVAGTPGLEVLGRLAGGIAHDFNNILGVILGTAEAMRVSQPPGPAAELRIIEDAALRGRGLVDRLLAVARQDAAPPQVIELNEALRGMAPLLERLLGPGIELELALDGDPVRIRLEAAQWDQVILNLAVNARDAMQGRGRLRIATSRRESDLAVVEVADDGPGIPAEVLPRIFDAFFTTRLDRGGTGLGLANVQGIVARAGGEIEVESTPARGATFRLVLPGLAWSNGPVLFVDDEPGLLRLAGLALADEAGLLTAPDAESALDLLRDGCRPALLATDVTLPGMDGLALARTARDILPGLPILLTSGYSLARLGATLPSGNAAFLPKPYTMAELRSAVRKALLDAESP